MSTTVQDTGTYVGPSKGQYHFTESPVANKQSELDPLGWIIKYTGQVAEKSGTYITLFNEMGDPEAAAMVSFAEQSQFQKLSKLPPETLKNAIHLNSVWISPHAKTATALPAILYLALRRGRIWGRQNVVALIPVPNPHVPLATLMHLEPLDKVAQIESEGGKYMPVAQRLKYAIHKAYQQCDGDQLRAIQKNFVPEVLDHIERFMERFYQGAWASAIRNGTLAKEQYISTLYNTHEYVRLTTRILGRCVAFSDERTLRNHFIYHLKGEINHELFIESDLRHLGADVDYLRDYHVPYPSTKQFMTTQESTIGYYQDPLMLLACPLVAEGVSANLDQDFLTALYRVIEGWGVKQPEKAATFLTSHARTDGGEDGHWKSVIKTLEKDIVDEPTLQRFLSVLASAMEGFERSYNANVEDLKLWAAKPVTQKVS